MHQRHVSAAVPAAPSSAPEPRRKKRTARRKRHKKQHPLWELLFPGASRRRITTAAGGHDDTELLATWIQLLSVSILVVCGITLGLQKLLSMGDWDEDFEEQHIAHHDGQHDHPSDDDGAMRRAAGGPSFVFKAFKAFVGFFGLGFGGRHHRRHGHHFGTGLNAKYPKVPLPPSPVYEIPGAMPHIGDKSDRYAALRKEYDAYTDDELPFVASGFDFEPAEMHEGRTDAHGNPIDTYDIYDCPDEPPEGYPYSWKLLDVLDNWPSDDPEPRDVVYQGLCVFDHETDLDKAYAYREAEVPFVVRNDPEVSDTVRRWGDASYLPRLLGEVKHRTEYSENNHFLYWNMPPDEKKRRKRAQKAAEHEQKHPGSHRWRPSAVEAPPGWSQPTEMLRMPYEEWLGHANVTDDALGPDEPHWYYRLIGCGETGPEGQCDKGSSEYLFDELPFFQPKENIYMVDPDEQKGIHCRFGMKGVIAENHFDGSRNAIVVLGGMRRYILAHPDQCPFLSLLPKGHPSARHSAIDWSDPDLEEYPEFGVARGNEVVLTAGDALYLPTNWFHYIVSLTLNYQCNTRSGISQDYMPPIHQCGF